MAVLCHFRFHRFIVCQRCFLWCSCVGHLSRHSANRLSGLQRGGLANLNRAVCPSAACSSPCGAKVPHAIAVAGLLSCGSQLNAISSPRLLRPSPSRHASTGGGSQFVFKYQGPWHFHGQNLLRLFPACGTSGTIPSSQTKGELAHATLKHHSPPRHGRLVLLGRSLSHQPNCSVNPTPTSSACGYPARFALRCGLPLALGFSALHQDLVNAA